MTDNLFRDAEGGDPYACLALAYYYQTGKELDPDIGRAVRWYERAASLGCARAHWELYRMISEGVVDGTHEAMVRHLITAAEFGSVLAQAELGGAYAHGDILPRDIAQAFVWYRKAAEQGHSLSKFVVGYMYAYGLGVEKSPSDAEVWFSSAGITGSADMFLKIGMYCEYGLDGVRRNDIEAARWYKYGVDMGYDKCILCWNAVLSELDGGEREPLEERLERLAATPSQVEADEMDTALARADALLESGDMEGAYAAYHHAADLGSPPAMFYVAMMHHQGMGVSRDDIKAISLLSRAADAGSEDAQFYLARTYESSSYPTDESQIVKLYADAASNGFLAAYYYLSKYEDHPERYVRRTHMRR